MLSFKKIIYSTFFLISACGFSPLYTNHSSAQLAGQISIQEPQTQNEFVFYSHLIDRFNESGDKYTLNYTVSASQEDKALNLNGIVHRVEISASVLFSLIDKETGLELFSDKEEMYLSYSNFGSTAAVLNAERTKNKEIMVLLADKVADRISLIIVEKDL